MKKIIAQIYALFHLKSSDKWKKNAIDIQLKTLFQNIKVAKKTQFGMEHSFEKITSYEDFKKQVPIRNYEDLKSYIELIKKGKKNILWKNIPAYFAKTSGTTSGSKYIPISQESMPFHIQAAKSCLLHYINQKNANFISGKMIFVQGSPILEEINSIKTGRLSGIVAHFVPKYLQKNRLPSWKTNCIEDWETKVIKIVEETEHQNMTLISGIPPWIIMYFEKLHLKTGKKIIDLFPNLQLLVTGGVNYEPYRLKINELIGKKIDVLQTFPASEGFIAFQDDVQRDDLLLLVNHGIFYEFIPLEEYGKKNTNRLMLQEVELKKDYALILTTNAGLWAYDIGDTVQFTSKDPYRIKVSGRTSHYTSAFGEHVIAKEVEESLKATVVLFPCQISEFTVAPQVNPTMEELPYHEWFIEFETEPENIKIFTQKLDEELCKRNTYYNDLITGKVLQHLRITKVKKFGFSEAMKKLGKTDAQSKLPRLSNDRKIADVLEHF